MTPGPLRRLPAHLDQSRPPEKKGIWMMTIIIIIIIIIMTN